MKVSRLLTCLVCTVLSRACPGLAKSYPTVVWFDAALEQQDLTENARYLRETGLTDSFYNSWYSAISTASDSTSSTWKKCKLPNGDIVVIGKSSKSAKSSSKSSSSRRHLKKTGKLTDHSKLSRSSAASPSSKAPKSAKSASADIPYCSELTIAPTPNQGANSNAPTFAPTPSIQLERCNNIRDGTGDVTGTPSEEFKLFAIVESNNELGDDFAQRLTVAMRAILALAAGCETVDFATVARRLQVEVTAVELEGYTQVNLGAASCEEAFGVPVSAAVCTAYESLVRIYGGMLSANVMQICEENGARLALSLGVEKITCIVELPPYVLPGGNQTASPTSPTTSSTPPTASPTSSSDPNESDRNTGESIETGGWIAIAAAILILLSLCLCYLCSRRAAKDRAMEAYVKDADDDEEADENAAESARSMQRDMDKSRDIGAAATPIFTSQNRDTEIEYFDSDGYATDGAPTDEEGEYPMRRNPLVKPDDSVPPPPPPSHSLYSQDLFAYPPRQYTEDDTVEL